MLADRLGAATVYGIVKQNDGFIEVTSAPGQGTTFAIYLPRTAPVLAPAMAAAARPIGGAETVLVVEDEQLVLDLTATMLERLGYAVLVARSGREALAIAHEHPCPIDLLVTDVVMPSPRPTASSASTAARARPLSSSSRKRARSRPSSTANSSTVARSTWPRTANRRSCIGQNRPWRAAASAASDASVPVSSSSGSGR